MSGLSAEEPGSSPPTRRPDGAPSSPPTTTPPPVGRARSPTARVACAREWMDELCVCLAACVTGSVQGWVRTHAETGKETKTTSEEKQKLRNATTRLEKVSGKKFCQRKRLILLYLKGRTLDMEEKKKSSSQGLFFFVLNYCWVSINWHWTLLMAGVQQQCIELRCFWAFLFASSVFCFILFFIFCY